MKNKLLIAGAIIFVASPLFAADQPTLNIYCPESADIKIDNQSGKFDYSGTTTGDLQITLSKTSKKGSGLSGYAGAKINPGMGILNCYYALQKEKANKKLKLSGEIPGVKNYDCSIKETSIGSCDTSSNVKDCWLQCIQKGSNAPKAGSHH